MEYIPQPNRYVNKMARRDIRARKPEPPSLEMTVQAVAVGGVILVGGVLLSEAARSI